MRGWLVLAEAELAAPPPIELIEPPSRLVLVVSPCIE